jgi:hypothetical protein
MTPDVTTKSGGMWVLSSAYPLFGFLIRLRFGYQWVAKKPDHCMVCHWILII